jgi:hypothetical protein
MSSREILMGLLDSDVECGQSWIRKAIVGTGKLEWLSLRRDIAVVRLGQIIELEPLVRAFFDRVAWPMQGSDVGALEDHAKLLVALAFSEIPLSSKEVSNAADSLGLAWERFRGVLVVNHFLKST